MTEHASPALRQHMLDLVEEFNGYKEDLQIINKLTVPTRIRITKRMAVIVKEMKDFRKRYPDD